MFTRHFIRTAAASLTVFGALLGSQASPASAARQITQTPGYVCTSNAVAISPPRVWASGNRPERAGWAIGLQRYNGRTWVNYSTATFFAMFDYYGRNNSGWSVYNTTNGGRFVNSRMTVYVRHTGYYRVVSAVNAPGRQSTVLVNGANAFCQVG